MDTYLKDGVKIPLGSFLGLSLLGGSGPCINLKVIAINNVVSSFTSEFESVGINQTRHSVLIEVASTLDIILPGKREQVTMVTEVLVCEGVIVGKIPEVYIEGSIFP